jgi:hypothetical protein
MRSDDPAQLDYLRVEDCQPMGVASWGRKQQTCPPSEVKQCTFGWALAFLPNVYACCPGTNCALQCPADALATTLADVCHRGGERRLPARHADQPRALSGAVSVRRLFR